MNHRFATLLLLTLLPLSILVGSPTVLTGKSTAYAGKKLSLYTYREYLIRSEILLGEVKPDTDGSFSLSFDLSQTSLVFFHLGKDMVYLYAEPGVHYEVMLPPRTELNQADLLNPYFVENEIMMGIENADSNSLNASIARFDDDFGPIFATYAMDFYNRENYKIIDSIADQIQSRFSWNKDPYFTEYTAYKIAMLRNVAFQFKARNISNQYFLHHPVLSKNPAYMELFHRAYENYFQIFSRLEKGNSINSDLVNAKSYFSLDQTIRQDSTLQNDTLRALVILKNLHDEFYKGAYSRTSLLEVLDSFIQSNPLAEQRETGKLIRQKVIRLLPGFTPPAFELYNRDGKLVKLSDFKGKYVYLGFCNCFSYSCLKEFEMLSHLYEKHKDRFVILTISSDSELKKMSSFLAGNNYPWTFLHYGNKTDILKDYDIRAFPTYFVIAPDGKLLLSPAPGPGENIESYLFQLMRARGDL
jgi:peroxiredoxin